MKLENYDENGVRKGGKPPTSGLFIQNGGTVYDLDEFYKQFMEIRDPTCYKFALEVFTADPRYERWEEFKRICVNPWFANYIQRWLEELEIKMRSEALQAIKDGCDAKDFPRHKWMAEGKAFHIPKTGKPTKAETQREERMQASLRRTNPDAYEIVKGS
jgi:hypothetical protein